MIESRGLKGINSVEKGANYEGNYSLLLFARVNTPKTRAEILNLLEGYENYMNGRLVEAEEPGKNTLAQFVYKAKTRLTLESELQERISEAMDKTTIAYSDEEPYAVSGDEDRVVMNLEWCNPHTGLTLTTKQKSITEAHEKGHVIRPYDHEIYFWQWHFQKGFDPKTVLYTKEDYEIYGRTKDSPVGEPDETEFNEAFEHFSHYIFRPTELAERMSQLKNYFGFSGDEEFTIEHLNYARDNYIRDTGFDNAMTHFFRAITPEKEEGFLSLMNTAGI